MATSVRLSEMLKREVAVYAANLGISVNALVAVALRDYLDSRVPREVAPPVPPEVGRSLLPASPQGASSAGREGALVRTFKRKKAR